MSVKEYFNENKNYCYPIVLWVVSSNPTYEYLDELKVANSNGCFNQAIQIVNVIGNAVDTNIFEKVTGDAKSVISIAELEKLKKAY